MLLNACSSITASLATSVKYSASVALRLGKDKKFSVKITGMSCVYNQADV